MLAHGRAGGGDRHARPRPQIHGAETGRAGHDHGPAGCTAPPGCPARRAVAHADAILDATDTTGDPADALARLVAASWQIVHQFRNILLAAQRELPAERIRGVHDPLMRRLQSLIGRGQRAGTFRSDLPKQWLITTAFSLMHAAAEDVTAGRLRAEDAAHLITATLLAAFTPPAGDALNGAGG